MFVASYNQNWGATLGIPNISPALMPAFSANGLGSGAYTTAPGYAQLYGLTTGGPTRGIGKRFRCVTISARSTARTPSKWLRDPELPGELLAVWPAQRRLPIR